MKRVGRLAVQLPGLPRFERLSDAARHAVEERPKPPVEPRIDALQCATVLEALQKHLVDRVLEIGEVRPVGGTATRRVDVRIVAATNEALKARVDDGTFRPDLYYRIAVLPIQIPPLRERPEDLRALAALFAAPATLTDAAERRLAQHGWPGNVRELRNVIAMARLLAPGESIDGPDIEPLLSEAVNKKSLLLRSYPQLV